MAVTICVLDKIPLPGAEDDPNELPEGVAVIMLDYHGVTPRKLVAGPLAPGRDGHSKYDNFVPQICELFGTGSGESH